MLADSLCPEVQECLVLLASPLGAHSLPLLLLVGHVFALVALQLELRVLAVGKAERDMEKKEGGKGKREKGEGKRGKVKRGKLEKLERGKWEKLERGKRERGKGERVLAVFTVR